MASYGEVNRYRICVSTKDIKLWKWGELSETRLEVLRPHDIYRSTEGFMKISNSSGKPWETLLEKLE